MNKLTKMGAVILLAFFVLTKTDAQVTKTLRIDSINVLGPILIGGNTDFEVSLSVTNLLSLPDTLIGDLFYYYQTDSMVNAGMGARVFLLDSVGEMVTSGMLDTITIDIQPNELRTTPVNLIVVWPAMIGLEPIDSISDSIWVYIDGFAAIPSITDKDRHNIVFPCPALQYIHIRQEELSLIKQIKILSLEGKLISEYTANEFSSGIINLDHLASGSYLIELNYFSNESVRTKILKR